MVHSPSSLLLQHRELLEQGSYRAHSSLLFPPVSIQFQRPTGFFCLQVNCSKEKGIFIYYQVRFLAYFNENLTKTGLCTSAVGFFQLQFSTLGYIAYVQTPPSTIQARQLFWAAGLEALAALTEQGEQSLLWQENDREVGESQLL